MGFADDVRNSYSPVGNNTSDPNLCLRLAEKKYKQAKERLMSLAKSGNTKERYFGIGIIKTRVVETSIGVTLDKKHVDYPYIPTFDGEECMSIMTSNVKEYNKVVEIIRKLCTKDGVNIKIEKETDLLYDRRSCTILLWIKV